MATVAVIGLDKLRSRFAGIITKFPAQVDAEIQYAGLSCQKYAKQLCPVDTGRLRSSIQYVNGGLMRCTVGTNLRYSAPVEFGHVTRNHHSYVAPRAYLRPSFEMARTELITALKGLKIG